MVIGSMVKKDFLFGVKLYGSTFFFPYKEIIQPSVYGNWVLGQMDLTVTMIFTCFSC